MPRPRDETYVVDLCDAVLDRRGSRGHRFEFLRGDPGRSGRRACLPVDVYYPDLRLVVEYHERQHSEPVVLFDRRMTVSGVTRAEQRRLYDARRRSVLPDHDIAVVEFSYAELPHDGRKRLKRSEQDRLVALEVIRVRLAPFLQRAAARTTLESVTP